MEKQNTQSMKEIKPHGTKDFPCALYQVEGGSDLLHVKHHWHDEIEILYFKQGHFIFEINMEKYEINKECLCFVNSGELHHIYSITSCAEAAVVFQPQLLSFSSYDMVQAELLTPLVNHSLQLPRMIDSCSKIFPEILQEFLTIVAAYRSSYPDKQYLYEAVTDDWIAQLMIKTSLLKILSVLATNNLIQVKTGTSDVRIEAIKTSLSYIKEHYEERIYIRDLAKITNMNEQYFCRFFKKAIGKTPITYINECRIRKACELLQNTDMQVMNICLLCGFNNLGNFMKEFKKEMHITPLKYRKEALQKKSK